MDHAGKTFVTAYPNLLTESQKWRTSCDLREKSHIFNRHRSVTLVLSCEEHCYVFGFFCHEFEERACMVLYQVQNSGVNSL